MKNNKSSTSTKLKPNTTLPLSSPKNKVQPKLKPQSIPKSKHKSYILKSIKQLQSKIQQLKLLKQSNKQKDLVQKVRYIDVPIERIVQNQIIEYVDRIVQKQEEVIEYEPVEKIVEVIKEVPKEVWTQRVIVRPPLPPDVVTVEVPVIKEIVKYVEENFDQRLYEEVEKERRHCQELELQLEANLRTIHRLKEELTQLHN